MLTSVLMSLSRRISNLLVSMTNRSMRDPRMDLNESVRLRMTPPPKQSTDTISFMAEPISFYFCSCLQCFDTVGWASGSASGLQKLSDEVLVWLSICSEVQIVCVWSSWCHCHPRTPSSLASFKSRLVLPFWYRLSQVVLEKRPMNRCSVVAVVLYWAAKLSLPSQQTWASHLSPNLHIYQTAPGQQKVHQNNKFICAITKLTNDYTLLVVNICNWSMWWTCNSYIQTRSSATADGPRDTICQSKSCHL